MIENDEQLQESIEQLERMYQALAELRSRVKPASSQWFELMAEGPAEEVHRLQADIDSYLGVSVVNAT